MLETRLAALNFINTGSEEAKKIVEERYAATMSFMEEAKGSIRNPQRQQLLAKADDGLKEYHDHFGAIVKYRDARNELVKSLGLAGVAAEKALTEILTSARTDGDMIAAYNASLATRDLLLARVYGMRFLDDNSQEAVDRVRQELSACLKELNVLSQELKNPERRRLLGEAMDNHKKYSADFDNVVNTIFERNKEIATMVAVGGQVGHDLEELKLSFLKDQDELGPKVQAANDRAITLISILALVAVLIGVLAAVFIIRGILRQLGCDPSEIGRAHV